MREEVRGVSDTNVDLARLAHDLAAACNRLDADGYVVLGVLEVTGGNYRHKVVELACERDLRHLQSPGFEGLIPERCRRS